MKKEFLTGLGIPEEQIAQILAENEKDVKKAQDAAAKQETALQEQIAELNKQITTFDEQLKNSAELDVKAKEEIQKLQAEHKAAVAEMQKKYEAENTKIKREAETKEFFNSIGKKFVTPEVRQHFENALNAALEDKANEGKNRADIYKSLIAGEDGNERTDIYAPETRHQIQIPAAGDVPASDKKSFVPPKIF